MVPKTHFSEIPVNQGHVRVMLARKDANILHSLPCHHLHERPHRITLLGAGKLISAVLLPSREKRRKVGEPALHRRLAAQQVRSMWTETTGARAAGQVAACAPEAWPVPAHGAQSPGRWGAPGAAGLCSSNPGEQAHLLTPKGEPPGGPGTAQPRPGAQPSATLGDRRRVTARSPSRLCI